jgi:hypothetical protein
MADSGTHGVGLIFRLSDSDEITSLAVTATVEMVKVVPNGMSGANVAV